MGFPSKDGIITHLNNGLKPLLPDPNSNLKKFESIFHKPESNSEKFDSNLSLNSFKLF
jgi:hypothetical protein